MMTIQISRFIGAAYPPKLRLWALSFVTAILLFINTIWSGLDNPQITAFAALAIVLAGIPHGTLDIEIASARFNRSGKVSKVSIAAAYIICALIMILCWMQFPEGALTAFLVISIIHFSADWRGQVDPFLAAMVGWALIGLPALSHLDQVAAIFTILVGNQNGTVIAQLLACAAAPAALGSIVFAFGVYQRGERKIAIDVISCMIAALFLPPLIAFALFFCGLHSPRHMADAMKETGALSHAKKIAIIAAVSGLSIGIGALIFIGHDGASVDANIIRTAFILLSTLTVPHFILEQIAARKTPPFVNN